MWVVVFGWAMAAAPAVRLGRLGTVLGVRQGESDAFLGMRYAAPPVGPLRFQAAALPSPYNGTAAFLADRVCDECIQDGLASPDDPGVPPTPPPPSPAR